MKKILKNKKGFTLVELVVVIAILAILALILVPSISNYVNDANEAKDQANTRAYYTAAVLAASMDSTPTEEETETAANTNSGVTGDVTLNPDGTVKNVKVGVWTFDGKTFTEDGSAN